MRPVGPAGHALRFALGACVFLVILSESAADPLTVGVRRDAPPFAHEVRSDATGAGRPLDGYAGLAVDICRAVLERIGASDVHAVPVDARSRFPDSDDGMQNRPHVLCDPTSVTAERLRWCSFSFPYFVTGIAYLTRTPDLRLTDLSESVVGLVGATTAAPRLQDEWHRIFGSDITPTLFADYAAAVAALGTGTVRAIFGDRDILERISSEAGGPLFLSQSTISIELYAFCVRPDRPDLLRVFNETLADLYRSARIYELIARHFDNRPASSMLSGLYGMLAVPLR